MPNAKITRICQVSLLLILGYCKSVNALVCMVIMYVLATLGTFKCTNILMSEEL